MTPCVRRCRLHRIEAGTSGDAELFGRIVRKDREAFASFYDLWAPVLFNFCVRILRDVRDAEDVLQEVFVQVWREAGRYDPTRASLKTWLFTITRSRALDRYRSRRSVDRRFAADSGDLPDVASGEDVQTRSLLKQAVVRSLARLSENEQAVLKLAYFEGYTQEEIAARLNEPLGTVKSRARSGLAKLAGFFAGEGSGG